MKKRRGPAQPAAAETRRTSAISLQTKQQPVQQRAIDTFELILEVTGRLLGEVGVERLSTNLVCQEAGLTPPALYRYFPNKYAILKELGTRLMKRMNEAFLGWLEAEAASDYRQGGMREHARDSLKRLQETINAITLGYPGSAWILRAMRAVPALQGVRLDSHAFVSEHSFAAFRERYPLASDAELALAMRLSTEVMYAATEWVVDHPELDQDVVNTEIADMVARYFDKFAEQTPRPAASRRRGRH